MPLFYKSDHPGMRDFAHLNGAELDSQAVEAGVAELFGYIQ